MSKKQIQEVITKSLREYFDTLEGHQPTNVYNLILKTVEQPILETVMLYAKNNQSQASDILGINRNTLRKKLIEHGLI